MTKLQPFNCKFSYTRKKFTLGYLLAEVENEITIQPYLFERVLRTKLS